MSNKLDSRIQHARNGGEKKIGNYKLDGYIEESAVALEFYGCRY